MNFAVYQGIVEQNTLMCFFGKALYFLATFLARVHRTNPILQESFDNWDLQFGSQMLPPRTALVCLDENLCVKGSASNETLAIDGFLQPFVSWKAEELGDNPLARCEHAGQFLQLNGKECLMRELKEFQVAAVPVRDSQGDTQFFLGLFTQSQLTMDDLAQLLYSLALSFQSSLLLVEERKKFERMNTLYQLKEKEFNKHEILFEASKKLHSKIDVHSVLTEVIDCMGRDIPICVLICCYHRIMILRIYL